MKVLYAGSFNPFHIGHKYVYDRVCKYFGKENVIIGIGYNPSKSIGNAEFLKWTIAPLNADVKIYKNLTSEFCKENNIDLIIRGIRPGKSLEYEEDLMYWNQKLGGIETIFIPTPPEINQISSSVIRELGSFKHDIGEYIGNKYIHSRWKSGSISKKKIYFGRTCMGKSTYLKAEYGWETLVVDIDKRIWQYMYDNLAIEDEHGKYYQNVSVDEIKNRFKEAFDNNDIDRFKCFQKSISHQINWKECFRSYDVIDFPVLGNYIDNIPVDLLAEYELIRIEVDDNTRDEYRKARKMTKEKMKKLDALYVEPPFCDNVIS